MLSHLSFAVADLERAAAFYDAVLASLGYARVWTAATAVGYGLPGTEADRFALKLSPEGDALRVPGGGFHLAFLAPSRAAVDHFHAAALAHGGRDHGAPGLRPAYGPDYYAAFAIDPDGYRVEAVCHGA